MLTEDSSRELNPDSLQARLKKHGGCDKGEKSSMLDAGLNLQNKTIRLATPTLQAWNFMELDLDMRTL